MPLATDPIDPTRGQATPETTGLVEHVWRLSSPRQRMRNGGPGNASTDNRDRPPFLHHGGVKCTPFKIHSEFRR
jgi:hypothetical protein